MNRKIDESENPLHKQSHNQAWRFVKLFLHRKDPRAPVPEPLRRANASPRRRDCRLAFLHRPRDAAARRHFPVLPVYNQYEFPCVTRLEGVSVCIAACAVYRMQSSLICSRRRAQVDDSTGSRRSTLEAPRRFAGQQRPDARGRIEGATGMPRGRRQTHLSRLPQNLAQHEVAKEAPFFPSVPEVEQETWLDEAVETAKKYCAYIQPHSHFDQKREREDRRE